MITLLMCLFLVLWSISAVNKAKLQVLQKSLAEAFSGNPIGRLTTIGVRKKF